MIRKPMLAIGVAAAFALAAAAAQAQSDMAAPSGHMQSKAGKADQAFMKNAIQGDLAEVRMGHLAQQKGASEGVKQFGRKLVHDHGADEVKAKQVAQSLGVTPPGAPSAKQKAVYDRLNRLSGAAFDRAFAREMVRDHEADIRAFDRESKKIDAAGTYAKATLPGLHAHLRIAQSLSEQRQSRR